jgi:hypothetical protein
MGQEFSDLEGITDDLFESEFGAEISDKDPYEIEFGEHYFIDPEQLEIDQAIKNEQEKLSENQNDHYRVGPHQLEIQKAIKEVQEPVDEQPSAVTLWILHKKEDL